MNNSTMQSDEVIVVAAGQLRRRRCNATGQALIDAMQACPYRDVDIEPERGTMSVRDVSCDELISARVQFVALARTRLTGHAVDRSVHRPSDPRRAFNRPTVRWTIEATVTAVFAACEMGR